MTDISTVEEFEALRKGDDISIVLFSNDEKHIASIYNIAVGDDYNRYYRATGDLVQKEESGTVKILRSFDEDGKFTGNFRDIKKWISKLSRPAVLPFDDRTVQSIFGESLRAVIFFDAGELESDKLRAVVNKVAKGHEGDLIFTEVDVIGCDYVEIR